MNDFHQAETSPINMHGMSTNIISDNRNMIIIGLIVLLILAVLGINILYISGNVLQYTTDIFEPFIFINAILVQVHTVYTILKKTNSSLKTKFTYKQLYFYIGRTLV